VRREGNLVNTFKLQMALSIEFEAGSVEDAGRIADTIEDAALERLVAAAPSIKQSAVSDSLLLDDNGRMLLRPRTVCAEPLADGSACAQPATEIVGSDGSALLVGVLGRPCLTWLVRQISRTTDPLVTAARRPLIRS
jgi:hypothetical protein